ncbi:VRR-NUC domain-containing protein [Xanthobacter sp. DSM 24535]|uniref:VRR-NUC domain-containing protein n=1 Tax=Roseixanthobacter psychrophilus TaxID=3119917 RepID=UPI0037297FCD
MSHIPDPRRLPIKRPAQPEAKKVKIVRNHEEDDLQTQIVDLFNLRSGDDVICFSVPNGARVGWKEAKKLKRTGLMKGMTDLVFANLFGLAFFMESKSKKGSLRKEQRDFRDWCLARNIPWCRVRTLAEAEAFLLKHSLIRPLRTLG